MADIGNFNIANIIEAKKLNIKPQFNKLPNITGNFEILAQQQSPSSKN